MSLYQENTFMIEEMSNQILHKCIGIAGVGVTAFCSKSVT